MPNTSYLPMGKTNFSYENISTSDPMDYGDIESHLVGDVVVVELERRTQTMACLSLLRRQFCGRCALWWGKESPQKTFVLLLVDSST